MTTVASDTRRERTFHHRRIDVGEVTLHIAEAKPDRGLADAPLVVLLHGFPEFWGSWRHQLRALADAGYWAVAPDMRGYNESDRPEDVASYEIEKLTADVAGLVHALGRSSAHVVAHDWGAVVAWQLAQDHADVVEKLAILNVPHPLQMMRGLRRPKQMKKSWYIFFFQLPRVPERWMAKNDYAALRRLFRDDGFSEAEIEPYVEAMKKPGAATAAINYYRAAMRRVFRGSVPKQRVIEKPVLVIWGDRDIALGKEMAEPPARFVPNARTVHLPDATHWVQNSAPEEVNRLLLEFLGRAL